MSHNKSGLSSPMSMQLPVNRDGDKRDLRDSNDQGLSAGRDKAKADPTNVFQENLNGKSYVGPVNQVAADCVASPMNGPRCDATGVRESELGKKQGF
jgi:hypothetical protein